MRSLKASFQIWLCLDSKKWKNLNPSQLLKAKEPQQIKKKNKKTPGNHDNTKFMKFKKPSEQPQTSMNCGLINKGNTCYINGSLQSFSSMLKLWDNFSLQSDTVSPFVSPFVRTMLILGLGKQLWAHSSFFVACRTLSLSLENKVLICSSRRMLVR